MEIEIIYEDEDLVAVNKPSGLVVHHDGKTNESTLVDWIIKKYPDMKGVGEPLVLADGTVIDRPGIVHRIDRETSGIILIAKNQAFFETLKSQFKNREITKTYILVVRGTMNEVEGVVNRPIGRSNKDFRMWSAQRGARGTLREAITEYKVLETTDLFSLIEAHPKTGRTHQIRVHFKAINHTLVCDSLYAPTYEAALGFNRMALHAHKIEFEKDGQQLKLVAKFPSDFRLALKQYFPEAAKQLLK